MQGGPVATVKGGFVSSIHSNTIKIPVPKSTANGCGTTKKDVIDDPCEEAKCGKCGSKKTIAHLQLQVLWKRSNPLIDARTDPFDLDIRDPFTRDHSNHLQVLSDHRGRGNPRNVIPPWKRRLDVQFFNFFFSVDPSAHWTMRRGTLLEATEENEERLIVSHNDGWNHC